MPDITKIVIACDSFKGSLTSAEANAACARGLRMRYPDAEIRCVSVADGGEGTAEALAAVYDASPLTIRVPGPVGDEVDAPFYISADRRTAIIDTASAYGLPLIAPTRLDPMSASSYGTGRQIAAAIGTGCRNIIIGLGGSAGCDGGTGLLQALGFRFLDARGMPLGRGGAILPHIASIDSSRRLQGLDKVSFTLYADVDNVLCGPEGAAHVFGPQKGATPAQCEALDEGLACLTSVLRMCGYDDTSALAGAGAAGGIGATLCSVLGARLHLGAPAVLDAIDFENIILDASLIVTGEGRLDATTLYGKTPFSVLAFGRRFGIPVAAIGGCVTDRDRLIEAGFKAIVQAMPGHQTIEEAMRPGTAVRNISIAAASI